jgi:rhomboid protease GluP
MKKRKMQTTTSPAGERLTEFDRQLKQLGRFAPVTAVFIAINVIVWVSMVVRGVHWLQPDGEALKAWGANFGPLTTHNEGWRLLTACFLHAGLVQLLINQWALWQYGEWLERFFGHLGFALLYLLTGLGTSLVAIRWQPEAVLVGSTGPIAGLIGAVAAFCWRVPGAVPKLALNRLRAGTFVFLGYNIGYAVFEKRLDAAGFLSGLMFGFIGGLVLSQPLADERRPRRWTRNSLLAAVGLVIVLASPYLLRPDPALEFDSVQQEKLAALKAFQSAYDDLRGSRIDEKKFIEILGEDVLPPWGRALRRLEELARGHLAGDEKKIVDLTLKSMQVREQSWNLLVDSLLTKSDDGMQRAADQFTQAEHLEDEAHAIADKATQASHERQDKDGRP